MNWYVNIPTKFLPKKSFAYGEILEESIIPSGRNINLPDVVQFFYDSLYGRVYSA